MLAKFGSPSESSGGLLRQWKYDYKMLPAPKKCLVTFQLEFRCLQMCNAGKPRMKSPCRLRSEERSGTLLGSILTQLIMIGALVTLAASHAVNKDSWLLEKMLSKFSLALFVAIEG